MDPIHAEDAGAAGPGPLPAADAADGDTRTQAAAARGHPASNKEVPDSRVLTLDTSLLTVEASERTLSAGQLSAPDTTCAYLLSLTVSPFSGREIHNPWCKEQSVGCHAPPHGDSWLARANPRLWCP